MGPVVTGDISVYGTREGWEGAHRCGDTTGEKRPLRGRGRRPLWCERPKDGESTEEGLQRRRVGKSGHEGPRDRTKKERGSDPEVKGIHRVVVGLLS